MREILKLEKVNKEYGIKGFKTRVLKDISFNVNEGDFIAIMGPSGAGKTTLLNLISTLDNVSSGRIFIDGIDISKVKNSELSKIRRDNIGFIFQDYNLLDNMSLMDNIALPLALGNKKDKNIEEKVVKLSKKFGLKDHLGKYPYELSGGQKQRGSVVRALITSPKIIYADEPTGALDTKASSELLECLSRINAEEKTTIVMVTHDAICASYCNKVYILTDGEIKCHIEKGDNRKEFYNRIIDLLASLGGAR